MPWDGFSGEVALPTWTLSDVEEYLLARAPLPETEREEESPCWSMLSALDFCDGKEAREEYYAGL